MTTNPRDLVIELLQIAASYDNRHIDAIMVDSWLKAANGARWTADAAIAAIYAHYAESTDRIMPGHITARLRQGSRQPAPAALAIAALGTAPASVEAREAAKAAFAATARTHEPRISGSDRRTRPETESPTRRDQKAPVRPLAMDLGRVLRGSSSNGASK